jgi:hypothetical protein
VQRRRCLSGWNYTHALNGIHPMKKVVLGLAFVIVAVLLVGFSRTASKIQRRDVPPRDQLSWFAKEAKQEGRQKTRIPGRIIEYGGAAANETLGNVLASSTVLTAHLIKKQTYKLGGDSLVTWHKFRIDQVMSEGTILPCPACGESKPPEDMLPLQLGEFLLSKSGGTMIVDGVEIEQLESGFPEFQAGRPYLLFLHLYPTGYADTVGGPVGVFSVDTNGNFSSVGGSSHPIVKELADNYGNSLTRFQLKLSQSK